MLSVVPDAAAAGSQLTQGVTCDDPVQVLVAEGPVDLKLVGRWPMDHELGTGTRAVQHGRQRHGHLVA
jgi:hypothetical protein